MCTYNKIYMKVVSGNTDKCNEDRRPWTKKYCFLYLHAKVTYTIRDYSWHLITRLTVFTFFFYLSSWFTDLYLKKIQLPYIMCIVTPSFPIYIRNIAFVTFYANFRVQVLLYEGFPTLFFSIIFLQNIQSEIKFVYTTSI